MSEHPQPGGAGVPVLDRALARSLIPEVLFAEDIHDIFPHLSVVRVCRHLLEGRFGRVLYVAGRPAVLRPDLVASLQKCAGAGSTASRDLLDDQDPQEVHDGR